MGELNSTCEVRRASCSPEPSSPRCSYTRRRLLRFSASLTSTLTFVAEMSSAPLIRQRRIFDKPLLAATRSHGCSRHRMAESVASSPMLPRLASATLFPNAKIRLQPTCTAHAAPAIIFISLIREPPYSVAAATATRTSLTEKVVYSRLNSPATAHLACH